MKVNRLLQWKLFAVLLVIAISSVCVSCGDESRKEDPVVPPVTPENPVNPNTPTGGAFVGYPTKVEDMTLEEKVGQLLLARCVDDFKTLTNKHTGGIVMFAVDFKGLSREIIESKIETFQKSSKYPLIIAVDEEGGSVVRVSSNTNIRSSKFLSPREYYEQGGMELLTTTEVEKAKMLSGLGINMNLAPVADISVDPLDFIYKRSLGLPADKASECMTVMVEAAHKNGVATCLKHFPGYGNNVDTHTGIAIDQRPYTTFETSDFLPFIAGIEAGTDAILVSHNIINCIDDSQPASISPGVHKVLRETLGYEGLIITDDMSMGAMTNYGLPYIKAVLAGNDMIIVTDFQTAYNEILTGVNTKVIPMETVNAAVKRVLAWKLKHYPVEGSNS